MEIFTLTYGSLVLQLFKDLGDVEAVNKQLDKMGYNIGIRLIDEFLAKSKTNKCQGFRGAMEKVAKILDENPFVDYVELPRACEGLQYCIILCGVIRGALEQVKINVGCKLVRDTLNGDDVTELRITLASILPETYPYQDDD